MNERAEQRLREVTRRIQDISTLPHIAMRILEVECDPKSSTADLSEVLEQDPALSSRVLRYVNSAAYGVRAKITNLRQAVTHLGLKRIRNLAVTASVSELFQTDQQIGSYRRSTLWRHQVSVAMCARMIGKRLGLRTPEDIFLAGLLHDIGIILEDQYAHSEFEQVMLHLPEYQSLPDAERHYLGFDHTRLGEVIGGRWGFPKLVRLAIRYHHASEQAPPGDRTEVQCVEVANLFCTLKGITSVGRKLVRYTPETLKTLGLTRQDVALLGDELDTELERGAELVRMVG